MSPIGDPITPRIFPLGEGDGIGDGIADGWVMADPPQHPLPVACADPGTGGFPLAPDPPIGIAFRISIPALDDGGAVDGGALAVGIVIALSEVGAVADGQGQPMHSTVAA